MTAVSIDVPAAVLADFVAMVRANYPETAALTPKQCYVFWLRARLKPELEQYRKRRVDMTDYTAKAALAATAQADAEAALRAAQAAQAAVNAADADGVA